MSVKIRLSRHGAKKQPYYRIVVSDTECPRDGKFLEIVGNYNPNIEPAGVTFKEDRVRYWMDNGALPSTTVKQLMKKSGVFKEKAA
ncbi:MAG: 30S ribosomal protein S16 [Thermodesulfobacteriota bacterium]